MNSDIKLVDRNKSIVTHSIKYGHNVGILNMAKFPQFDIQTFPYLLVRDKKDVSIVDLKHYKTYKLLDS